MSNVIVGMDVGGTNIRMGSVDSAVNLTEEKMFSSRTLQGSDAVDKLLGYTKNYISSLKKPVKALSIGFPSTINATRDTLINTPNLEGFSNIKIKPLFEDALGLPVFVNKDATMLLHFDMYKLRIGYSGVVAAIYIGTGIGNSIIVNGNEFIGNDGVSCELGHIPVPGRNDPCSCGLKGCMEIYAGGKGLEKICREKLGNIPVSEAFTLHGGNRHIKDFVSEIACAVATEINILNPGYVVLGGGVLQMEAFPADLLVKLIKEKTRKPIPGDSIKILFSENGNPFTGVIGAALYAAKQLTA